MPSCASARSKGIAQRPRSELAASDRSHPHVIDRITTRVSQILRIRYPILQAGMVWASSHKLAVACAEADILGCIGAGSMKPDFLREQIQKARALTKKRLSVNIPLLRSD